MLHIHCPYCEEFREEEEFTAAGEAHIERPPRPDSQSDEDWARYLFYRKNPRGPHGELWYHLYGCRRFFTMVRDTVSYRILATYRIGEQPPIDAEPGRRRRGGGERAPAPEPVLSASEALRGVARHG